LQLSFTISKAALALNKKVKQEDELEYLTKELEPFIKDNPTDRTLHILLGRLYRWLGDFDSAIRILDNFIINKKKIEEKDEDYAVGLYNKACYYAILYGKNKRIKEKAELYKTNTLENLKESISIHKDHKKLALEDSDFASLKEDKSFKLLSK
jgi:tetratricopeptide (TPR) repeat protein